MGIFESRRGQRLKQRLDKVFAGAVGEGCEASEAIGGVC